MRPHAVPNMLPIHALDPTRLASQQRADTDKEDHNPNLDPVVDFAQAMSMVEDMALVSYFRRNDHSRAAASALLREKEHFRAQRKIFLRDFGKRKKIEEDSEERDLHRNTSRRESVPVIACKHCGLHFPSGNQLHQHLVDEAHKIPGVKTPGLKKQATQKPDKPVKPSPPEKRKTWTDEFVVKPEDLYKPRNETYWPPNLTHTEERAARRERREIEMSKKLSETDRSRPFPGKTAGKTNKLNDWYNMSPPRRGKVSDDWERRHRGQVPPDGSHRGQGAVTPPKVRNYEPEVGIPGDSRVRGRSVDAEPWNRQALEEAAQKQDEEDMDREEKSEEGDSDTASLTEKVEEAHHVLEDDVSDAETVPECLEKQLPKNFWMNFDNPDEPFLELWSSSPDLEQVLFPDSVLENWKACYPTFYGLLKHGGIPSMPDKNVAQAKIKINPKKEVPRPTALQDEQFWKAMEKEIDQLKTNGADFLPPPKDGSFVYSSRWVFTYKEDGTRKARLVVRGFEEADNPDSEDHATDSPTLHRDSMRLIAFTAANRCWHLRSTCCI